jgi:hypothetical protein
MAVGDFRDLFAAIAGAGGALTGLLFVALSVTVRPDPGSPGAVIHQVRVAAALLAFSNAMSVALYSLVPGTNTGYPALVLGIIGILFTAAAIRSIRASRATARQQLRQIGLIGLLLMIFGVETVSGIVAVARAGGSTPVELIGYALVTSLIVGIARAWELVGDRNTGILASLSVLAGRTSAAVRDDEAGRAGPAEQGREAEN